MVSIKGTSLITIDLQGRYLGRLSQTAILVVRPAMGALAGIEAAVCLPATPNPCHAIQEEGLSSVGELDAIFCRLLDWHPDACEALSAVCFGVSNQIR